MQFDEGNYDGDVVEIKQSFIFPDRKGAQKRQHPQSWKDQRIRTSIRILCDSPGLPIYVDDVVECLFRLLNKPPKKNYHQINPIMKIKSKNLMLKYFHWMHLDLKKKIKIKRNLL